VIANIAADARSKVCEETSAPASQQRTATATAGTTTAHLLIQCLKRLEVAAQLAILGLEVHPGFTQHSDLRSLEGRCMESPQWHPNMNRLGVRRGVSTTHHRHGSHRHHRHLRPPLPQSSKARFQPACFSQCSSQRTSRPMAPSPALRISSSSFAVWTRSLDSSSLTDRRDVRHTAQVFNAYVTFIDAAGGEEVGASRERPASPASQ
jgi:hypothetical protein